LFDKLGVHNDDPNLAKLEERLTSEANTLGIGPMGFGGQTTVIETKIAGMHRLPASFFVSVSYMCWAYRRRKMTVKGTEIHYD
jgi:fumarate hydratase class I